MFPDRGQSFNGLKHLTEKVTAVASLTRVRVVVDHAHNAHPTAKINKVKDLALPGTGILISVFTPSRLHLLPKTSPASVFLRMFSVTFI